MKQNIITKRSFLSFRTFLLAASLSGFTGAYLVFQGNAQVGTIGSGTVEIVPNPALTQTCGLDIALALDLSNTMTPQQRTQIKNAAIEFSKTYKDTGTQISVTKFAQSATVVQGFTADPASISNSINASDNVSGESRWEPALQKTKGTFDPRPASQNLIIIITGDKLQNDQDFKKARMLANDIKKEGTRILMVAVTATPPFFDNHNDQIQKIGQISGGVYENEIRNTPNSDYQASSGNLMAQDILTSTFAELADTLTRFAKVGCNKSFAGSTQQPGTTKNTGTRPPQNSSSNNIDRTTVSPTPLSTGITGPIDEAGNPIKVPSFTIAGKEFYTDDILNKVKNTFNSVSSQLLQAWPLTLLGALTLIGTMAGFRRWRHSKNKLP